MSTTEMVNFAALEKAVIMQRVIWIGVHFGHSEGPDHVNHHKHVSVLLLLKSVRQDSVHNIQLFPFGFLKPTIYVLMFMI